MTPRNKHVELGGPHRFITHRFINTTPIYQHHNDLSTPLRFINTTSIYQHLVSRTILPQSSLTHSLYDTSESLDGMHWESRFPCLHSGHSPIQHNEFISSSHTHLAQKDSSTCRLKANNFNLKFSCILHLHWSNAWSFNRRTFEGPSVLNFVKPISSSGFSSLTKAYHSRRYIVR